MARFRRIYLEISNVCNLRCAFCPGTARPPRAMTEPEYVRLLPKLRPWTEYLYFHLMGEPLCHRQLGRFLELAGAAGFRVILTTNGTLLGAQQQTLLAASGLHKVNVSLHALEANGPGMPFGEYLAQCFEFGRVAAGKKTVVYRLWNAGGADGRNDEIVRGMEAVFPRPWIDEGRGLRIADRVYLERGSRFDWPDLSAPDGGGRIFCRGLRDQLGVLCDGTVVPCCLDHEGDLALGNLFAQELGEILTSPRAQAILRGFSAGDAAEALCRRCGYAHERFAP